MVGRSVGVATTGAAALFFGGLLWFSALSPAAFIVHMDSLTRCGTGAFGILLAFSGAALLAAWRGWGYLAAFLAGGFSVGRPVLTAAFNAHLTWSAEMIAAGEASALTCLYWASITAASYGFSAAALGVLLYGLMKRTRRLDRNSTSPYNPDKRSVSLEDLTEVWTV